MGSLMMEHVINGMGHFITKDIGPVIYDILK